ncbi:MAG: CaiB/BaiF CoA-transferase family protein [Pseudomonadota bacterium]|nr:CaiB/BaiF CoA-transferase family protein [Pseudomonadota bacterium]
MSAQDKGAPLAGLRVVELHAIGPVPFAGMMLGNLGAEVLRISPPSDPSLGIGIDNKYDVFNNRKTPKHIDLKSDAGRAELLELLATADVMTEGFRPGVLERLGLAPADLAKTHPKLVIGRLSGWGNEGPYAARAGHDINYLGLSGILNAIGKDEPIVPLNVVADFGGGAMTLLVGVLAKLVQRSITGRGGVASTSILAGTIGLSPMFHGMIAAGRWNLERCNNLLDGKLPFYRVYRTGDGRFMSVGALEAKFYAELLKMLGLEGEIDPARQFDESSFATTSARFAEVFATRTRDEWARLAEQCDACVAPVLDFKEAAAHPHNRANGWYVSDPFPHPRQVIDFQG